MKTHASILSKFLLLFVLVLSINSCGESEKERKARENYEAMDKYVKENAEPVTVREVICPICRGTGKLKCKECKGTGKVLSGAMDCPECDGFGYFICQKCGGFGKYKELK